MKLIFLGLLFTLTRSQPNPKWPTKVISKSSWKNQTSTIGSADTTGSFQSFIQNSNMWVDKSMLIKRILESPDEILKITAPFGWGKTINLEMVKFYAQLSTDDVGTLVAPGNTPAYMYFVEGRILATRTKGDSVAVVLEALDDKPTISTQTDLHDQHLARYPVVHLRGDRLDMNNLSTIVDMIWNAYQDHEPLRNQILQKEPKKLPKLDDFYDPEKIRKLPTNSLKSSIKTLCKLLNDRFKKKVLVLFDDYDVYMHKAYLKNTRVFEANDKTKLFEETMKDLMDSTFNENPTLAKGVITGVLNMQDSNSSAHLVENIFVLRDGKFSSYYGISQDEFAAMMKKANFKKELVEDARKWYGGYSMSNHPNVDIFSPSSLTKCINERKVENYLINSSLADVIPKLRSQKEVQNELGDWMKAWGNKKHHPTNVSISSSNTIFTAEKLAEIQRVQLGVQKYDKNLHRDMVFSLLFQFGLATLDLGSETGDDSVEIRPPNMEVCDYFGGKWTKPSNQKQSGKSKSNNLKSGGKRPKNSKSNTIQEDTPKNSKNRRKEISKKLTIQQATTSKNSTIQQATTSKNSTIQQATTSKNSTIQQATTSKNSTIQQPYISKNSTIQQPYTSTNSTIQQPYTSTNSTIQQPYTSKNATIQQPYTSKNSTIP